MEEDARAPGHYEESRPSDDRYNNKNNGRNGDGPRSQRGYSTNEDYYGPPPRRGDSYGQIGSHKLLIFI